MTWLFAVMYMRPCAPIAQACFITRRMAETSFSAIANRGGATESVPTWPSTTYGTGGGPSKVTSREQSGGRAGTTRPAVLVKPV